MSEPKEQKIDESSKDRDLEQFRQDTGEYMTTNHGVGVNNTNDSLKVGERGPTLIEDFHLQEKLSHFDRERIPERVVHARGSGAHGYFQVYESLAKYTKANFLQDPSVKTPVFARFSTVAGFRGSADTVRDARGFSVKFYTEEGNYDLVGNNIPVFFIQDGIKFPDIVHALKPEPHNEMPQAAAAHDNFWDFISLVPESMHMIMWILSDRALPRSYRMMQGFGVHTFRFVNEQLKSRFVKFHWKPLLGVHSLVWDEAQKLAGKDPDFHRRDLWKAIEMGDYPEYELGVQIIEEEDEFKYGIDILDATKLIPEEIVPVTPIGKMVLNRNPDNFFAETEQVAFNPARVVSGIDFSNDPLLQGRLFSYHDTQLHRLGSANFPELPINRPVCPVHNNQRDAVMQMKVPQGKTNYFPNSIGGGCPMMSPENMGAFVHYKDKVEGEKVRVRSETFSDHFSQATLFWNSLSSPEKEHLIQATHFELGKVDNPEVKGRLVDLFNHVDHELAKLVSLGIGVPAPSKAVTSNHGNLSPALSIENNSPKETIKTRQVAILAAQGFDFAQLTTIQKALKKAGALGEIVSQFKGTIESLDGKKVEVDKTFLTSASVMFDAVYIPGGQQSVKSLKAQTEVIDFINEAFKHCKSIAATGEGVDLVLKSQIQGLLLNKPSSPEELIIEKGVIISQDPAQTERVALEFIKAISAHRHWTREVKQFLTQ